MTTAARRSRGESAGLTRTSVVAAAETLADRIGFADLSLRAVAAELGVSPAAIYNHISNKDELVDAVADAFVARELLTRLPARLDPLARVRELARRLHRAGVEHPGLLSALVGHIPEQVPSHQMEYAEQLLQALVDAGASLERATLIYRTIVALCLGSAVAQANTKRLHRTPLDQRLRAHAAVESQPLVGGYLRSALRPGRRHPFEQQLELVLHELTHHERTS